LKHLLRAGVRGDVPVGDRHAPEEVPDAAADQVGAVPGPVEPPEEIQDRGRDPLGIELAEGHPPEWYQTLRLAPRTATA
jgi:hypothetical protein